MTTAIPFCGNVRRQSMTTKLFYNARIYTPIDQGAPLAGKQQGKIQYFEPGAMLCRDGLIHKIGTAKTVLASIAKADVDIEINCQGRCLIPGFVDPHTHMCFIEPREAEFALRLKGASYLEILHQGGGILSSVRAVRAAADNDLFTHTRARALAALRLGTTTLEIKSGYGLDTATELKMLTAIERLGRETPLDVVPTFMGAHAIPEDFHDKPATYVKLVIKEMLPATARQGIARFCDIFCEKGVFTLEQSRRILQAAKKFNLGLKVHADEMHDLGGAGLAAELKAVSAEHLLAANDDNLEAMAAAGVMAVLLPATAYSLREPYARARKMIALGVPVALATDCNPGSSYTESMPFVIGLAVLNMGLTPAEALTAATLNAAYALDMAPRVGSLDIGKQADFSILEGDSPAIIAYHAGVSPVAAVYKLGEHIV